MWHNIGCPHIYLNKNTNLHLYVFISTFHTWTSIFMLKQWINHLCWFTTSEPWPCAYDIAAIDTCIWYFIYKAIVVRLLNCNICSNPLTGLSEEVITPNFSPTLSRIWHVFEVRQSYWTKHWTRQRIKHDTRSSSPHMPTHPLVRYTVRDRKEATAPNVLRFHSKPGCIQPFYDTTAFE